LNEEALYAIYEKKDIEKLEEKMEEEEEFNLDEAELLIETLAREKPEYLNYIKSLQLGTRSCKKSLRYAGVLAYFRKGDVDSIYILNHEGEIISDMGKVISELRCSADEKQLAISKEDKHLFSAGLRRLEESFKKDYQYSVKLMSKKDTVIVKAIKKLAHFRKEIKNDEDLRLIDEISNALNRGIPDEVLKDIRRLERAKADGSGYIKGLIEIYNRYRMGDLKTPEREEQEYKPVELICCEVLK